MNTKKLQEFYRTRRGVRYGAYLFIALCVFALIGFVVLPPVVKSVLIDQASKALHRSVAVQGVSINPFTLTVDVTGLSIKERGSEALFLGFESLHVNLDSASLFKGGVVIGELRLLNPRIHVVRLPGNRYNFSDLLDSATPSTPSAGPAPSFSVSNVQLQGGAITFDDASMKEKHEIRAIDLSLPFVSNMAYAVDTFVEPSFSAEVNGAPVHAKGKSKPFSDSLESELLFDLSDLKLSQYLDYVPFKLPIQLASGALDSALKLSFRQDKTHGSSLGVSGKAALRNLDIKDVAGAPLLAFKRLDVVLASADVFRQDVVIDRIALEAPDINLRVDNQGRLNLMALIPGAEASATTAAKETAQTREAKEPSPLLTWSLGEFSLSGGTFRLQDDSRSMPFKGAIENLELHLKKLTSRGEAPAELSSRFLVNRRGEVSLDGTVSPFEQGADLNLSLKGLELLPFQSYFAEKLNVAITRGQLALEGNVRLRKAEGTASGLAGQFTGQATLGDFQAVDKVNSADFLRWKSFYFGKLDINLSPMSVTIGEIALSDFFARIIVSPEGKLNLMQLVRQEEAAPELAKSSVGSVPVNSEGKAVVALAAKEGGAQPGVEKSAETTPVMPIQIGKITLQGGSIRFTDNFVKPNYTANLRKIGGRISGLSSAPGTVATLELRGNYDDIAPLTINARINPLSAKPFLDLQAEIKGVEMTSFSAYAGKYAGYSIDKGKLSLFVKYKIENDQLEAENRVFLDQLTFGNPVESPNATKLPVRLAVSLLKNHDGEIDLNLPISGSLNDPQFSVGGLVVKVIVNVLVKAVTSPFALLGSMFGGEELSTIEFEVGRSSLQPAAEKRLENLAKALTSRPGLKLEISAVIDPERELEAFKRAGLERKVKAVKREGLTRSGLESGSVDVVEISPEEYPALLERVYRAEKFPKPRNMIGMVKSLPVEEMEKLILSFSTVSEDDLRALGERRAKHVRDWLVEHQVPAERVFLLPTKVLEAADRSDSDKKASAGQVVFSLK